jgi:lipopolysaccharide/colanic/teichoic acid biosynthesis glycosyltransferase
MKRRLTEILAATLLLLLVSPLLLVASLAVLLTSGRPVFFGHERVGRHGRRFRCWKLRTMHVGAERRLDVEPALKKTYVKNGFKIPTARDPRVTPVGRLLRDYYIDELPQLFNVLNGTMSLVGPRPIVPDELSHYGAAADELLGVRPGIVGAWTSRGRERPDYPERVRVELEYVRNPSSRRNLIILARTIPVVLRGQGNGHANGNGHRNGAGAHRNVHDNAHSDGHGNGRSRP